MSQFESDRFSALLNDKDLKDELEDLNLDCIDCKEHFVWSVGEQTFFRDKGLANPPKRCKPCKKAKTHRIEAVLTAQAEGIKQKIEVIVDCAKCGDVTTVPFYPSQGRPVYCSSCFIRKNPSILKSEQNGNRNDNQNK
ncbi:MAG: zinc-ribbon domain containing protein [Aridibacter sp.]